MGVRVVAPGLEQAVAGTQMFVVGPEDSEEELKETVMEDMADIFDKVWGCEACGVAASCRMRQLLRTSSHDKAKIWHAMEDVARARSRLVIHGAQAYARACTTYDARTSVMYTHTLTCMHDARDTPPTRPGGQGR